jgi:Spy/CpxP family protein refolding chaperone
MRNVIKTGIVAAVTAVFVASVAVAGGQGPGQGQGQRRGPGFGGPGGVGGRGMIPGIMQELTEEQRGQVRAILQEQRGGQQGPPADAKLRHALQLELLAEVPNDLKIEELKAQIAAALAQVLDRNLADQKQIALLLTAAQRAMARERLGEGPRQGRGGRGPRGGR